MKVLSAGRMQRIGFVTLAFALAFLACAAAYASDVERRIPVIRDTAGSGLTTEISMEGTRSTATPFLTLYNPTVQRIEGRIAKKTALLASKKNHPEAAAAGSPSRIGSTETTREGSGLPETTLSSLPPVPGEITIRTVKGFLKGLRSSRKEKTDPAVVATAPELRLGMADTSQR